LLKLEDPQQVCRRASANIRHQFTSDVFKKVGSAQKIWFVRFSVALSGLVVPDSCDLLLTMSSSAVACEINDKPRQAD
jgi:hypothetical protein